MSSSKTGNTTVPTLIVFGMPKGAKAPHAAWFRSAYAERARTVAKRQGLTALSVESAEARAVAATLKEGQLKAGGQLVMPCVSQDMLNTLRRLPPVPPASAAALAPGRVTPGVNVPVAIWDTLKVTDVVLAAHLEKGVPDGWYEAVIMKIENDVFTLRWADYPQDGLVRLPRQYLALMYPG
jgi:hypothetical protein